MALGGNEKEYAESMEYWKKQSQGAQKIILRSLAENEWQIDEIIPRWGDWLEHVPLSFLKMEHKRLELTPKCTEEHLEEEIDATPLKNTLEKLSEQCAIGEAFAELVDNIFDNFERKGKPSGQESIQITFYFSSDNEDGFSEIILKENSGGVAREELIPLVRLGDSAVAESTSIGAWGQGSKIACFVIADSIDIFTYHSGDTPICIRFPNGWLKKSSPYYRTWDVKVYRAEDMEEGTTIFKFQNLKTRAQKADLDEIARYLGRIYSFRLESYAEEGIDVKVTLEDLLGDRVIQITPSFTLKTLEERHEFLWMPDYSPVQIEHSLRSSDQYGREIEVDLIMVVGILRHGSRDLGGVYMYGNDRLFTPNPIQDGIIGIGVQVPGKRSRIRKYGPPLYRLVALLFFKCKPGQAEFIPWAAPLKNRYNPNNIFHDEILNIVYHVIFPYSQICEGVIETQLDFFSSKWLSMDASARLEKLRRYFQEVEDDFLRSVAETHSFDNDLDQIPHYGFESIKASTNLPFGLNKASKIKDFLKKVNDNSFDLEPKDFLIGFFSKSINEVFESTNFGLTEAPDPAHLNYDFIAKRVTEASAVFETATLSLSIDNKEKLLKKLGLPDDTSATEIAKVLISKELGE